MKTSYVTTLLLSFFSFVEGDFEVEVDKLIDKFPKRFNNFQDICTLIDKEKGAYNKKQLCETKIFAPTKKNLNLSRPETAKCLICRKTCDAIKSENEILSETKKSLKNVKNMSKLKNIVKNLVVHANDICSNISNLPNKIKKEKCEISLFEEKTTKIQVYVYSFCREECRNLKVKVKLYPYESCTYENNEGL